MKKRGVRATRKFKKPLQFDLNNETSDQILEKLMDASEQCSKFLKVKPLEEILEDRERQDVFS